MGKRVDLFGHDRGFGDTLSRVIKTVTHDKIKECGGCKKRKEYLNKVIPFGNNKTKKYES